MDSDNELTKPVTKKGAKPKEVTPVTEAYAVTNHKLKKPTAKQLKELKKIALQEIQAEINGTPTEEVSSDEEPIKTIPKTVAKKASPAPASVPIPTKKEKPSKTPTPTKKPKKQLPSRVVEESDTEVEEPLQTDSEDTEVEEEIIVVKKPKKEKPKKKKKKVIRKIVIEDSSDDNVTDSDTDSDPEPPKRHTRETKSQQHHKTKIAVAKPASPYYFA